MRECPQVVAHTREVLWSRCVVVRRSASRCQRMGGGGRAARRSLVPRVVERLMYDDCATLGASCGGVTDVRRLRHTGGGLHAPVAPWTGYVERAARLGVAWPSPARLETQTKESMGCTSRRVFLAKPQEDTLPAMGGWA